MSRPVDLARSSPGAPVVEEETPRSNLAGVSRSPVPSIVASLVSSLALWVALTLSVVLVAPASATAEWTPYVAAPPTGRVLAISIDGLNPQAIRRLGRAGAPNLYRLMDEGAFTLNARTMVDKTETLPNHASMMTGRRVAADQGGHGVNWNDDRTKATVQGAAGHPVSSVFNVVHDAGGSTALFATKDKFGLYQRSWPVAISKTLMIEEGNWRVVRKARTDLVRHDRAFTFLHISSPDDAGHEFGFMSARYIAGVAEADKLLGIVLRAIDANADLAANLVVVLTADHGGIGAGHRDCTRIGNYRIPFIAWGSGVDHGHLYGMNPSYLDPKRDVRGTPARSRSATATSETWSPTCSGWDRSPAASSTPTRH